MEKIENDIENKNYKILIVDDEKEVLDSLFLTLKHDKNLNYEISTASSAEEALVKLLKQKYDLVLADYKMPGINGVELLTKVSDKYPNTARILITGYSNINTAKDAINKAKVDCYIEKPWYNEELRSIVLGALIRKSEMEQWNLTKVDNVKEALKIVQETKQRLAGRIPEWGAKQILLLEFKSSAEFNKFSFELRQLKNVSIDDMQIFENKYIVKIGIYLESFEKIK